MNTLLGGRYELMQPLATGARSDLYLANDRRLERSVVVKLLAANADAGMLERFRRDVVALADIDSDHIAQVFDLVVGDGVAFAVTKHVEGENLSGVLSANRRHEPIRAARYALDIMREMQVARAHRLVADPSPAHVVLAYHRAYLFGIKHGDAVDESVDVERAGRLFLALSTAQSGQIEDDAKLPPAFALIIAAALSPVPQRYPTLGTMAGALALALRQLE